MRARRAGVLGILAVAARATAGTRPHAAQSLPMDTVGGHKAQTALRDMRVSRGTIVPSDTQRLAGDIVRLLGGKAQYGIGDLARLADPAHRN
jgi:hypothetical protein